MQSSSQSETGLKLNTCSLIDLTKCSLNYCQVGFARLDLSLMQTEGLEYQEILKTELSRRCQSNPRYGLRAFARDLEISPSRLSQILNKKLGLSQEAAQKMALKLGLSPKESELFCEMVLASDGRSKHQRETASSRLQVRSQELENYRSIHLDAFLTISDWHHYGLIELLKTKDLKQDRKWMAMRLGISIYELDLTIERLKRMDLIQEKKGKLIPLDENFSVSSDVPSEAIRKFHKQILQKALSAVDTQSVDERNLSVVTGAVSTEDLPEYNRLIKGFRRKMNSLFEKNKKKSDQVYCLSVQFFRLTEKE